MEKAACENCGALLPTRQGRGNQRRFCDATCRKAAHRKNRKDDRCRHCGQKLKGKGPYCSDRCYYYANKGRLPPDKMHLTAWDEELVPFVPLNEQKAFEHNTRPDWHATTYGGSRRRGKAGRPKPKRKGGE